MDFESESDCIDFVKKKASSYLQNEEPDILVVCHEEPQQMSVKIGREQSSGVFFSHSDQSLHEDSLDLTVVLFPPSGR